MDRIVQLTVGFTVPDQFSVFLFVAHLQFLKDALVACTGKEKGALRIFSEVCVVMKRSQLVVDRHAPNVWADIVGSVINTS